MYATSIILLAVAGIVVGRDLSDGARNGVKVFDEKREASPAIWKQKANETIRVNNTEVISGIFITDARPDKDGEVRIVDGGVGQQNVTIELKSPTVFRGYEFHIEVYAVPSNGLPSLKEDKERRIPDAISQQTNADKDEHNGKVANDSSIPIMPVSVAAKDNSEGGGETKVISPITKDADVHDIKTKGDSPNPFVSTLDVSPSIAAPLKVKVAKE